MRKGCAKIYYICSHEKDYTEYNSQELRLLGHHRFPSDKREFRKVSDKPEDGGGGDGGSYPDGIYPFIHRAEPTKQTFQDDRTAAAFDCEPIFRGHGEPYRIGTVQVGIYGDPGGYHGGCCKAGQERTCLAAAPRRGLRLRTPSIQSNGGCPACRVYSDSYSTTPPFSMPRNANVPGSCIAVFHCS